MVLTDFVMPGETRQAHAYPAHTIRLTWSTDHHSVMVECNSAFCLVMGYSRDEVIGHNGLRLLRPNSHYNDADIAAIHQARHRLEEDPSSEEHISSYLETRDGVEIEIADAVMTYNPLARSFDVVADISVDYMPDGPQFRTPLDKISYLEWQHQKTQERMHDLSVEVEDMRTSVVARINNGPKAPRKTRSDKGERKGAPFPDSEFEDHLKKTLSVGLPTDKEVLVGLGMRHRTTLENYLKPYWLDPNVRETPHTTLRRLERQWFPDHFLV